MDLENKLEYALQEMEYLKHKIIIHEVQTKKCNKLGTIVEQDIDGVISSE